MYWALLSSLGASVKSPSGQSDRTSDARNAENAWSPNSPDIYLTGHPQTAILQLLHLLQLLQFPSSESQEHIRMKSFFANLKPENLFPFRQNPERDLPFKVLRRMHRSSQRSSGCTRRVRVCLFPSTATGRVPTRGRFLQEAKLKQRACKAGGKIKQVRTLRLGKEGIVIAWRVERHLIHLT